MRYRTHLFELEADIGKEDSTMPFRPPRRLRRKGLPRSPYLLWPSFIHLGLVHIHIGIRHRIHGLIYLSILKEATTRCIEGLPSPQHRDRVWHSQVNHRKTWEDRRGWFPRGASAVFDLFSAVKDGKIFDCIALSLAFLVIGPAGLLPKTLKDSEALLRLEACRSKKASW